MDSLDNPPAAKIALLRRVKALQALDELALSRVAERVDPTDIPPDGLLADAATGSDTAIVVVEGWAALLVRGEPVGALGPGDVIDEHVFADHGPGSEVVAKTAMQILVITADVLDSTTKENQTNA